MGFQTKSGLCIPSESWFVEIGCFFQQYSLDDRCNVGIEISLPTSYFSLWLVPHCIEELDKVVW